MRIFTLIIISILTCLPPFVSSPAWADETAAFEAILSEHWARAGEEKIFFRTDPDTFRPDGPLPDFSAAGRTRRQSFNGKILKRLSAIDPDALSPADRVSYRLFVYERETEAAHHEMPDHYFPITSLFGYHTYFANAPYNMAFDQRNDYERYLVSLADFTRYNQNHLDLLREAAAAGLTQYCGSLDGVLPSIRALVVDTPEESDLYAPFATFPDGFTEREQKSLRKRGRKLIREAIIPGYRALETVFTQTYLPACRQSPAVTSIPGGDAYYAYLLRFFTTTDMTPSAIHALGLGEVARIRTEMEAIINAVEFDGDFDAFLTFLRTDPQFYASTEKALLERVAYITKTMDGKMPRLFGRLARNTYEVRGTKGRGAYYVAAADDRTPGTYFIATGNLPAQPLYNLEALSLHEAVPGHHHQSAIARELDVPEFRKTVYHAAYGEGWGLYSERLGKEVGFYTDPYSDFGRLTYEMWRACRLVVDTGLHAFGWSRQQAIDYLLANTGLSQDEVVSEVDRYITWPGQATAYKIGELRILDMRARAEETLGRAFDRRAFHDLIVGHGSLPIALLDELVDQWIEDQAQQ
ncbi:MAG: DUF885 domain-containing protein [Pseudomonadota bacterium]